MNDSQNALNNSNVDQPGVQAQNAALGQAPAGSVGTGASPSQPTGDAGVAAGPSGVTTAEPVQNLDSEGFEEGSAEQFEAQQKDIQLRKAAFRKDLEAVVEKHLIAPDAHVVYSQHGTKAGVVLIDLKYGANVDVGFPTFEDEALMREIMQKAIVGKGDPIQ